MDVSSDGSSIATISRLPKLAGADVDDAQAQMRHSRAITTVDV